MRRGETRRGETPGDAAAPRSGPDVPGAGQDRESRAGGGRGALARLRELIAGRVAKDLLAERRAAPGAGGGAGPTP